MSNNRFRSELYENKTLHISLIVILHVNHALSRSLQKYQRRLLDSIHCSETARQGTIYKYPLSTFHFSIIVFSTQLGYLNYGTRTSFEHENKRIISRIIADKDIYLNFIKDWELVIERMFPTKKEGRLYPSIAANIYVKHKNIDEIKKEFKRSRLLGKLKIYNQNSRPYFPINLVRFFRDLEDNEIPVLSSRIDEINKELEENNHKELVGIPRLSLVISDNYLSNSNPEIAYF